MRRRAREKPGAGEPPRNQQAYSSSMLIFIHRSHQVPFPETLVIFFLDDVIGSSLSKD